MLKSNKKCYCGRDIDPINGIEMHRCSIWNEEYQALLMFSAVCTLYFLHKADMEDLIEANRELEAVLKKVKILEGRDSETPDIDILGN